MTAGYCGGVALVCHLVEPAKDGVAVFESGEEGGHLPCSGVFLKKYTTGERNSPYNNAVCKQAICICKLFAYPKFYCKHFPF